jgi:phosphinothricin acetyltransferase
MLAFIIDEATRLGYRSLLATIHAKNEASAALLKKFKFDQWGFYPEVVYNAHLDQWFDIGIFGRKLN